MEKLIHSGLHNKVCNTRLKKSFLIVCIVLSCHQAITQEKHIIGCFDSGFFSNFCILLNHLVWCERNNKIPVAYWDKTSIYYQPDGYNGSFNVWEYYFEPLSQETYQENDVINRIYSFQPDDMGHYISFTQHTMLENRFFAHELIKKYIKIKPALQEKIDTFFKEQMVGKKTIAIHLRGTDKCQEVSPVEPMKIIEEANKYEGYQYLVASDEYALLNYAKQHLRGTVICYECKRSVSNKPLHITPRKHPAKGGCDILIEVCLMALCDKFIYTYSNISAAVHFFNPNIDSKLMVAA